MPAKFWMKHVLGILIGMSLGIPSAFGWQQIFPNPGDSVEFRHFDTLELQQIAVQPDFDYRIKPQRLSYLQRFLQWLSRRFDKGGKNSQAFWKYVGIGLAVLAISLVIFQLAKIPIQGFWARRVSSLAGGLQGGLDQEDLAEMDFEEMISQAVSQENFRKALRLLFLESLSMLSSNGSIEWKAYKTNQDYARELAGSPYAESFRKLRLAFEYVWYGDFPLNRDRYEETAHVFTDFRNQVSQGK
ncbi:MAG: DUF4129 domain-containing protein [Bacteroidota bacterium]